MRPRRPEIFVLCDVSTSVTSASVFFLSVLHALHDAFRKMRSFVFIERVSEVTDVFAARARLRGGLARRSAATPASPTSPATPTTAACGRSSATLVEDDLHPRATIIVLGDARTNGRDPRADIFAQIAAKAGRTFWLNPEPRLYWNYGDSVISGLRGVLRGVRVLDDPAARGLRQGADAAGPRRVVASALPEPAHRLPRRPRSYWRATGAIQSARRARRRRRRGRRPAAARAGSRSPSLVLAVVLVGVAPAAALAALALRDPRRRDRPAPRRVRREADAHPDPPRAARRHESGPLQDSFGLATVTFHTAAGGVEIPALGAGRGRARPRAASPSSPGRAMTPEAPLHRAAIGAEGARRSCAQLALPILVVGVVGGGAGPAAASFGVDRRRRCRSAIALRAVADDAVVRSTRHRSGCGAACSPRRITSVPFDRVQAIDTVRGPVQRLFGAVELHVQTAGGGAKGEIVLKAVDPAVAEELREAGRAQRAVRRSTRPRRRPAPRRRGALRRARCSSPR